eukprot:4404245-Pyramimonas_sp.AAC.1
MYLEPQGAPRTRRDNTMRAGDLRLLLDEAHAELRAIYAFLERTFGLPDVDLTGLLQPADWVRPAAPGQFPARHRDNDD